MLERKQIAEMFNVSVATLRRRFETDPSYPKPAIKQSRKTVRWEPGDILKWAARQKSAQS